MGAKLPDRYLPGSQLAIPIYSEATIQDRLRVGWLSLGRVIRHISQMY